MIKLAVYICKGLKKEFMGFVDAIETFGIFIKAVEYPFSGLLGIDLINMITKNLLLDSLLNSR